MSESQSLVSPFFVQFHSTSKDNPDTLKAFTFLVNKTDSNEEYSGAVWCDDIDNAAGLDVGWNSRSKIGRGGPGSNVSWSPLN